MYAVCEYHTYKYRNNCELLKEENISHTSVVFFLRVEIRKICILLFIKCSVSGSLDFFFYCSTNRTMNFRNGLKIGRTTRKNICFNGMHSEFNNLNCLFFSSSNKKIEKRNDEGRGRRAKKTTQKKSVWCIVQVKCQLNDGFVQLFFRVKWIAFGFWLTVVGSHSKSRAGNLIKQIIYQSKFFVRWIFCIIFCCCRSHSRCRKCHGL